MSHNIDIHIDTLQACFASIHFVHEGSMYIRNVFRNMFQHYSDNYLWFIDLKQNNLIGIDGKVFPNLSHLNRLDASDNSTAIINYSGLLRLTLLNIDHNHLREVPNFCSENGSYLAHHLRELHIVNNRVQVLKTNDFQCAVRTRRLFIWKNSLREIQNNVFAPLNKLSSVTIHPGRPTLKHIQSYAFNASHLQSLSLADAHFKFRHQTFDTDNIFHFCPWLHTLVLSHTSVPSDSETAI